MQGTVEDALGTVLRLPTELTVAGRTDAGVHAVGQVAHADVPGDVWTAHESSLLRHMAGVLPADVRLCAVAPAPSGFDFDARFSALSRRYEYYISDAPWGVEPLRRHQVAWCGRPLHIDRLRHAARRLLGEHDFAAYCRHRAGAGTVRTLLQLDWDRLPDGVVVATVGADAFCHNMVRGLVGALIDVGTGRRDPDWPAAVLAAGVRDSRVNVAPAHGLVLVSVRYPDVARLAARAGETRRRRATPIVGP